MPIDEKRLGNLKAIIFDMDGTLTDSMYFWDEASVRYLENKGVQVDNEIYQDLAHMTALTDFASFAQKKYLPAISQEQIYEEFGAVIEDFYRHEIQLKPGIKTLIENLAGQGIKMGIATGNERRFAEICLNRVGLLNYFQCIISVRDVGKNKKYPDVYNACRACLQTPLEATAVAEDSPNAIGTAKRAGYFVIGAMDACWSGTDPSPIDLADISMTEFMYCCGVTER